MESKVKLKKAPAYRFVAFILMLLAYLLVYAGIQMVASVGSDIMSALGVGEGKLSLLSSLGSLAMAILSFFAGTLIVKYGGKKTAIVGLAIMAVSGALYLMNTESFAVLCIYRLIQGAGTGMASACLMSLVCAWFPKNERGTAQGALGCFYGVSISLVTLYAFVCKSSGMAWNATAGLFLLVGGSVIALLIAFFYKDIEKAYGVSVIDEAMEGYVPDTETNAEATHNTSFLKPRSLKEAIRFPGFWILGITLFFYCGCAFGTGFVLPLFLDWCGFDESSATSIVSVGSLSSVIFALLGGVVSDRIFKSRRCEISMISFFSAAVIFTIMALLGSRVSTIVITIIYFLAYGAMYICAGPIWCLPAEIVAPEFAAQNMGTCLLFSGLGGFVMTNVFGFVTQGSNALIGFFCLIACMILVGIGTTILKIKYRV